MRAQQERAGSRLPVIGKLGHQIYELDLAPWSVITESLTRYPPTETTKFVLNVFSRFFERFRSRGSRPEINEPLNMSKRFLAGEFVPDPRGCCAQRSRLTNQDGKQNQGDL